MAGLGFIYLGDVGTDIYVDAGMNIAAASVLQIKYEKPDGTTGTWNAVLSGTTSLLYQTQNGDIDQTGNWLLQASVVLPGWSGRGQSVTLLVKPIFT